MVYEGNCKAEVKPYMLLEQFKRYEKEYLEKQRDGQRSCERSIFERRCRFASLYNNIRTSLNEGHITVHDLINARAEALEEEALSELEWAVEQDAFTEPLNTALLKKAVKNRIITKENYDRAVENHREGYINVGAVEINIRDSLTKNYFTSRAFLLL